MPPTTDASHTRNGCGASRRYWEQPRETNAADSTTTQRVRKYLPGMPAGAESKRSGHVSFGDLQPELRNKCIVLLSNVVAVEVSNGKVS